MKLSIPFVKCHGTANDFVLIDEFEGPRVDEADRGKLAQLFSDRKGSVGADGVLFFQRSERADARMRMFNPDGSEARNCGNGLRCIARYAMEALHRDKVTIEVDRKVVTGARSEDIAAGVPAFTVEVGPVSMARAAVPINIENDPVIETVLPALSERLKFTALTVPNPHLIAFVDKISEKELVETGLRIASSKALLPDGANVSFVSIAGPGQIAVSTFERGAGITLSCGTGMAASTYVACLLGKMAWETLVTVFCKGGVVRCQARQADPDSHLAGAVQLSGNATYVFSAEISVDLAASEIGSVYDQSMNLDEIASYNCIQQVGQDKLTPVCRA